MKNVTKILIAGITALAFTACGGGGSTGSSSGAVSTTPPPNNTEPSIGGSVGEPTRLIADGRINKVMYGTKSYFIYTAEKGERLIMHVILDRAYTKSESGNLVVGMSTERFIKEGPELIEIFDEQYEYATDVHGWGPLQSGGWENKVMDYRFNKGGTYILNVGISIIPDATFSVSSIKP